jgi:hypothetical protein
MRLLWKLRCVDVVHKVVREVLSDAQVYVKSTPNARGLSRKFSEHVTYKMG